MELDSKNSQSTAANGGAKPAQKKKPGFFANIFPNLRFLQHLARNPCNSDVHERDKWLLACLSARTSSEKLTQFFDRVNAMLDTQALVCTFIAGFSFLVLSDDIQFSNEMIPRNAIVALLGFSFVLSVATTLVAVTIKQHLTEIGFEKAYTFFAKYSWLMSLLAHLIIQAISAFMASGLMIMFNRFGFLTGVIMVCIVGFLFSFLGLLNLELRDRSMTVMGFNFVNGQYRLPQSFDVWLHDEALSELHRREAQLPKDANEAMCLSRSILMNEEMDFLRDPDIV